MRLSLFRLFTAWMWLIISRITATRQSFIRLIIIFKFQSENSMPSSNNQNPSVLILFHACGIRNTCVTKNFIQKQRCLIIEDAVHRLVNPSDVVLYSDRHFLIDSLRKVSPLPGSFIYGTTASLSYPPAPIKLWNGYFLKSLYWFVVFRILLFISAITNNAHLASFAHTKLLKRHDDIIGDSLIPQRSFSWIGNIGLWFNFPKIASQKSRQVALYQKLTNNFYANRSIYFKITIPQTDYGSLHVFPLGLTRVPADFMEKLHNKHFAVWCKYEDSPWARHQHVLFLPLGFHISEKEITSLVHSLTLSRSK